MEHLSCTSHLCVLGGASGWCLLPTLNLAATAAAVYVALSRRMLKLTHLWIFAPLCSVHLIKMLMHCCCGQLLLAAGCDPSLQDKSGMTPLLAAAWLGKEACMDALLDTERGLATLETANNLGATPLIFACQENSKSIAEKLIAAGANLDAKDV